MNAPTQKKHRHRRIALLALAVCLLSIPLLALAQPAGAEVNLCQSVGSGAGQCNEPVGVATDTETGRVYVADRGNNRVDVFKADGSFVMAFGWGVADGTTNALQSCGPEASPPTASCFKGIAGSAAGQFFEPRQIAVDNVPGSASRHDVYVGPDGLVGAEDKCDCRVQKFEPDGSFVSGFGWGVGTGTAKLESCTTASTCQAGIEGPGECQLSTPGTRSPIAVGPGGNLFVADNSGKEPKFTVRVEKFSPTGVCLGETLLMKGNVEVRNLAIDSSEDAYVTVGREGEGLRKYDLGSPETKLCDLDPGIGTNAIALGEAGRLFASQQGARIKAATAFHVITEYDSACKIVHRFGYGKIHSSLLGLAFFHSAEGDVFGSEENGGLIPYLKIPPFGPIVAPESVEAGPIGNTKATLKAEVNPEGKATSYHLDYMTRKAFEAAGNKFEGPAVKSTPTTAISIKAGTPEEEERERFRLHLASAVIGCPTATQQLIDEGKCLEPQTEYVYRIVATNPDNPTGKGEGTLEGSLTTKDPIEVGDVYATEVGTDAATLNAVVNPLGIPANGYFEYVDEESFQASGFAEAIRIPDTEAGEEPIDFGSAETATVRSATISSLPSGTTYRYRLVADNPFLKEPLIGEERSFTTFRPFFPEAGSCPANEAFRVGPSALLPDCRAYEMVSPLDKANADIFLPKQAFYVLPAAADQAALSGSRLAYGSYRAFGDAISAPFTSQYIANRNPPGDPEEGWQTHSLNPPQTHTFLGGAQADYEFKAFSDDLCASWVIPLFEPTLAEGAIEGERNLYRREDQLCSEGGSERYEALSTARAESIEGNLYEMELVGRSGDGAVVAFEANDSLEGSQAPANLTHNVQLYVQGEGQGPRFACILPGGASSTGACKAGTGTVTGFGLNRSASVENALSADAKALFWSDSNTEGPIYVRENPLGEGAECAEASSPCTLAVSKAAEEEAGSKASHFWAAAKDGSTAIFSTGGGLYEFEPATKTTRKIAAGFLGFLGAGEDASHIYFASSKVLAEGASEGKANLYLHEPEKGIGSERFIATLAAADVGPGGGSEAESSATGAEPRSHNGRVSADGMTAAFMSQASLTNYDNSDVAGPAGCGKAKGICDTEVYLYDAKAKAGAGELLCVSCNPSGGRPAGVNVGGSDTENPFWVAAKLPVAQSTLYGSRVLAEDGSRAFFESQDPLVARDTNGRIDVYQWERVGKGDCEEAAPSFSAPAGGCIDLISSGQSKSDSEFIDASPDGHDVFLSTLSSLLPQDYGLIDIYDAREGGGFPLPPPPGPECEGESCQSPPAAPPFSTPATATYKGPANLQAAKKKHTKKHHHRRHRRHRRAAR